MSVYRIGRLNAYKLGMPCAPDCACNVQDQDRRQPLTLQEVAVMTSILAFCKQHAGTWSFVGAMAVLRAMCPMATRKRLALLVSVPVFAFDSRAVTLAYARLRCTGLITDAEVACLLDVRPCLRLGAASRGWRPQDAFLPLLQCVQESDTVLDAHWLLERRHEHVFLSAGALPARTLVRLATRRVWVRQWRAWHARLGRRRWMGVVCSV